MKPFARVFFLCSEASSFFCFAMPSWIFRPGEVIAAPTATSSPASASTSGMQQMQ